MIRLALDPRGRLNALDIRPTPDSASSAATVVPDWPRLFQAAGLDPMRFTPADAQSIPPMAVDARAAWLGTYGNGLEQQVRIEAAAWQGRPVFFQITSELNAPISAEFGLPGGGATLVAMGAFLGLMAVLVARRNLRLGRGDRHGAVVLGTLVFAVGMLRWLILADHTAGAGELTMFFKGMSFAGLFAAVLWTLYLAIEPPVRRIWPDSLISWSRLQSGRVRDPLVASHILVGLTAGLSLQVLGLAVHAIFAGGDPIYLPRIDALSSPAFFAAYVLFEIVRGLSSSLLSLLLLVLARGAVGNIWLACLIAAVIQGTFVFSPWVAQQPVTSGWQILAGFFVLAFVVRRFGTLALFPTTFLNLVLTSPVSLGGWHTSSSLMLLALLALVSGWALWVIVSQRASAQADAS
jgi:hypothetical protein